MRTKDLSGIILLLFCCLFSGCINSSFVITKVPTQPVFDVEAKKVLIVSTYDVEQENFRKKKKNLFKELIDLAMVRMAEEMEKRASVEAVALRNTDATGLRSEEHPALVEELMQRYKASDVILINKLDVYFVQTNVSVEINEDGSRSRTAYYDIHSFVKYAWYDKEGLFQEHDNDIFRFYDSRLVISGLLAAGPNVVKRSEDALAFTFENTRRYLNLYFPGFEERQRSLYSGKRVGLIKEPVKIGDYERALQITLQHVEDPNPDYAASANYNCAVLLEAMGRYDEVRNFLLRSIQLRNSFHAQEMLRDY
ncbi:MAG TPA: tetratricopeptide repeat protein [Cyclobacteriaceae bacterium]|nr:tetratricopeptide repeat protein [Cyclobacteriaceae bacterium]